MDDTLERIGRIYEAVGDEDRWQRLIEHLARTPTTPEIEYHLAIARHAHERHVGLTQEAAALSATHDRLALGVVVVDQEAQVLQANAVATRLLSDDAGLVLVNKCLQATTHDENAGLRAAIKGVAKGGRGRRVPFLVVTRPEKPPLSVFVLSAQEAMQSCFEDRQVVVLLLIDPDLASVPGTPVLRALFGFTVREAECAALLMQGVSIDEAARSLGVTRTTARTFLAHIMAKTDSHSQTELIARLLSIPRVV